MDKLQEIREALDKATPGEWKGRHAVQPYVAVHSGVVDEVIATVPTRNNLRIIANAPSYISYLLETVEQLQNDSEKLDKRIDDLRRENDQLHTQKGTLRHEFGKLELQNTTMKEALEKANCFFADIMSFYGEGLIVHNFHQNGDGEPWDNFFDDNGAHETFEAVTVALSTIEGGKADADASSRT